MEQIALVDENDKIIGYDDKLIVHAKGKLHRAFSLFIYDEIQNKLLIQKRALNKYHSGGLWTNACCSHQREGEDLSIAVLRRVSEELGVMIPEQDCRSGSFWESEKFTYSKDFGAYTENEIDHVFIWKIEEALLTLKPDKDEVEALMWINVTDLLKWMENKPEEFTVWFLPAFEIFANDVLR